MVPTPNRSSRNHPGKGEPTTSENESIVGTMDETERRVSSRPEGRSSESQDNEVVAGITPVPVPRKKFLQAKQRRKQQRQQPTPPSRRDANPWLAEGQPQSPAQGATTRQQPQRDPGAVLGLQRSAFPNKKFRSSCTTPSRQRPRATSLHEDVPLIASLRMRSKTLSFLPPERGDPPRKISSPQQPQQPRPQPQWQNQLAPEPPSLAIPDSTINTNTGSNHATNLNHGRSSSINNTNNNADDGQDSLLVLSSIHLNDSNLQMHPQEHLVEAVLVQNNDEVHIPQAEIIAISSKTKRWKLIGVLFLIVVAALTLVGILCADGSCTATGSNNNNINAVPSPSPTTATLTSAPNTAAPTSSPTRERLFINGTVLHWEQLNHIYNHYNNIPLDTQLVELSIPSEIGLFPQITSIHLGAPGGFRVIGSIPSELGMLTLLTSLKLPRNPLTGSIPTTLGLMTSMTRFELYHSNSLTGLVPSELGMLTSLTSLALFNNELTGSIPTTLGLLTNMTRLFFGGNSLTQLIPSEIGMLSSLTNLFLSGNQLSGSIPTTLGLLTNLVRLNLDTNSLTGQVPSELGMLTSLTGLWLFTNQLVGSIPTTLGLIANNMSSLSLYNNSLTGKIPSELGMLISMTYLKLGYNQLTGTIPTLQGLLTDIRDLGVRNNQLTGSIPTQLSLFTSITYLALSSNKLTGTIPSELGLLTRMTVLSLENNYFKGDMPDEVCWINANKTNWLLPLSIYINEEDDITCPKGCGCWNTT